MGDCYLSQFKSPITKVIFNCAMYVPVLAQLADSFVLLSVRAATGGRLLIALRCY